MRKAVFFDIDGTILDAVGGIHEISERVRTAMKNLQKAGHLIFIATGRPYAFLQKEILNFGFDGFVLDNGAIATVGDKIIFDKPIPKNLVKKVRDLAVEGNVEYIFESHPYTYCEKGFTAFENFFVRIDANLSEIVRDFDFDKISVSKIECRTERTDTETVDEVYKKILAVRGLTGWADPFHFKTLEIYSAEVSKATGIFKILEYFNIPVENSFAFGDGINDREMITKVGTGLAMGTGKEDLKRSAKYVVPGIHEDGVAVGIEKYILEAD